MEEPFETIEERDRISSLPDSLIVHVLSFLNVPDAVTTILLAKSWRYLWRSISRLDFQTDDWERDTDKCIFIDNAILYHNCLKLQSVRILFYYYEPTFISDVKISTWIDIAIQHNVEELVLDFYDNMVVDEDEWSTPRYKLPHSLYKCRSVTYLVLSFCDLNMPKTIQLSSLKSLSLDLLDLSPETITYLTSNCPLLESLMFHGCNLYSDLNITITNRNLKYLTIYDYSISNAHELIVSAPHLVSISFHHGFARERFCFRKLKNLKRVMFKRIFHGVNDDRELRKVPIGLLQELYYVEELCLSMDLVQLMSTRDLQGMHPLCFNATILELETEMTKWELPGVFYLLKSSPRLKTLHIKIPNSEEEIKLNDDFKDEFAFEEKDYWDSEENGFSSTLQNLEYVKIYFLSSTEQYGTLQEGLKKLENKVKFVQLLLKNSKSLKRIIIKCDENIQSNYELLSKLSEELILLPKASPCAAVDIT